MMIKGTQDKRDTTLRVSNVTVVKVKGADRGWEPYLCKFTCIHCWLYGRMF